MCSDTSGMSCSFLILFILFYALAGVSSTCHMCQSNWAICHDEQRFSMCSEGISQEEMLSCPNGYVCTGEIEICVQSSASNPVKSTCDQTCGLCKSPSKLFACIGETTYAYCFGADVPDYTATGICPDGYVCNLESRQVCTLSADVYPSCFDGASNVPTTLEPKTTDDSDVTTQDPNDTTRVSSSSSTDVTTESSTVITNPTSPITTEAPTQDPNDTTHLSSSSSTDVTTDQETTTGITTESPTVVTNPITTEAPTTTPTIYSSTSTLNPRDESEFCKQKQQGGFFLDANDPTCQQFILCYVLSGQYLGLRYTCLNNYFFNDDTKECQSERPSNC